MFTAPEAYTAQILSEVGKLLAEPIPDDAKLQRLWYSLCSYRAQLLGVLLRNTVGDKVQAGPFKDMQLSPALINEVSSPAPHLLGTYEHELHPSIEAAIATPYQTILNIGCNHGYYAVGFARRMPHVTVHAFDIEPVLAAKCQALAELNGVGDRVITGGLFRGEDFADYAGQRTLVFMDIEGAEFDLLDPGKYPALRQMDVIVELHAVQHVQLPQLIVQRFQATHDFTGILNKASLYDFAPILGPELYIDPVDSLLATWESRAGPTPWGVFRAKTIG